eukprot:PRCOL_00002672-RA
MAAKNDRFAANILKRGEVPASLSAKKQSPFTVGPVLLAFFLFVVVGSSLLQIIRTATSGGIASEM